jgi:hypothetical protein
MSLSNGDDRAHGQGRMRFRLRTLLWMAALFGVLLGVLGQLWRDQIWVAQLQARLEVELADAMRARTAAALAKAAAASAKAAEFRARMEAEAARARAEQLKRGAGESQPEASPGAAKSPEPGESGPGGASPGTAARAGPGERTGEEANFSVRPYMVGTGGLFAMTGH